MNDTTPSPLANSLKCRCPRCGRGRLFDGFLSIRERCDLCGLDYRFVDAGDGPAVFVILIAGAIVCGAALLVEVTMRPPYWVHAALWLPLLLVVCLGLLRPLKSWLITAQYRYKAEQGRLADQP